MHTHHYLGSNRLTGETLKQAALAEWGSAAFRSAPRNMATIRNLVIGLIRLGETARRTMRDIPVVMRRFARFPEEAPALMTL